MADPIRGTGNQLHPTRGDSLRRAAARAELGPRLAQVLRVLDRKIETAEAALTAAIESMRELIDVLEGAGAGAALPTAPPRSTMVDPFAMTRAEGADAVLVLAEQRLATLLRQTDSPDSPDPEICATYRLISRTPPATLLGAAVKLRLLLDHELGLGAIETSADDLLSLRQIRDLVERQG